MNILLICKRRYTNTDLVDGRFGRLYEIPKRWVSQQNKIYLLALSYEFGPEVTLYRDGIRIKSISLFRNVYYLLNNLQKLIGNYKPDVVIASGDSHIGYFGMRFARKVSIPFVFDLYHYYPDFGTNRVPFMRSMFLAAIEYSDSIVCDSEPLKSRVSRPDKRIIVIGQGVDYERFTLIDESHAKQELGLDQETVYIGYTGSIDARFDWANLSVAMERLYSEMGLKLLVAGLNRTKHKLDSEWITYLGQLPQSSIPTVIGASRLMIIPYNNSILGETCNPCKMSEYIACGKPIVSTRFSDVHMHLDDKSLMESTSVSEYVEKILNQLSNPYIETKRNELSWDSKSKKYMTVLKNLVVSET